MNNEKKKKIFVNNFSKSTKERKNFNNIQNISSKLISIKKRNNITNNNRDGNLKNNYNKKEVSTFMNTMYNLSSKKNKNVNAKCLENKNNSLKKEYNKECNLIKNKNLNIFEPNSFNVDYLMKRYKMVNFSDIKVKKMKSNFDSIILDYKKDKQKLNNIKSKLTKKNKNEIKENKI